MGTDKALFGISAYLRAQNGIDGHVMFISVEEKLKCAGLMEMLRSFVFVPGAVARRSGMPICRGGPPER